MNFFKVINDFLVNLTCFSEPITNQVIEIQYVEYFNGQWIKYKWNPIPYNKKYNFIFNMFFSAKP